MDSIKDVLISKDFEKPDEIKQVKDFIKSKFGEEPAIKLTKNNIIVSVSTAALAGALRPHLHHLQKELKTDKKLLIRIS